MADGRCSPLVYRGPGVAVRDHRCGVSDPGRGPEEASAGHEIVLPRVGVFVKHVRGESVVADANQVVFFNRAEPYRVSHPTGGGDRCTVFVIEEETLRDMLAAYDPAAAERSGAPFAFTHAPSSPEPFLQQQALLRRLAAEGREALDLGEQIYRLLDAVLAAAYCRHGPRRVRRQRPGTADAHRRRVDAVQLHLARRYQEPLGLEELAWVAHCSPFHLARIFRQTAGLSLHRYRNRLRLREALARLAEGARDLTAVALEVGFADHSHFSNAFRREFGVPPSACRAERCKQ
jgi:AraC family transcriptional regulator